MMIKNNELQTQKAAKFAPAANMRARGARDGSQMMPCCRMKNPPKCNNPMNPTRNERLAIINYRLR
jgi:hypothetical protein